MKKPILLLVYIVANPLGSLRGESPSEKAEIVKIIHVQGNQEVATEKIKEVLPFSEGDETSPQKRNLAEEIVRSLFKNTGYLEADVSTAWNNENQAGEFIVRISEGPRYRFGKTNVIGLTTLPKKIVDFEKTYKEGDPYNRQELFHTQSQLYLTGLLESVRIQTSTTTDKTADVSIQLEQKRLKWIKGGVGWGSEEKERVTLILQHENLWQHAHRMELMGTVSRIWKEYKTDYVIPYFLNTRTEQRNTVSWRSENREGHDFERTLASFGVGRDLTYNIKGSLAFEIKRTLTFNVDPEIASITPSHSDGRSLVSALNRDKTNDPFFPTHGTRTNLRLQRSGGFLGGNIHFNKGSMEVAAYESLWGPLVSAIAVRFGVVQEFPPSPDVPIYERFFMGGANSVRGYHERGVGPTDRHGNPLGGEWKFGSTFELRFPLFWRLNGALFIDGGQVGPTPQTVDPNKWKFGGGGGIRLKTPVGPIRLDYGYKLNREPGDTQPWRIHFSLGESF